MKWIKYLLYFFVPLTIAVAIYFVDFESVFGEHHVQQQIDSDDKLANDDSEEETDKVIKFKIGYGIKVINTDIIPPTEVEFQENFMTSKDVVESYSEYNIDKNFYYDKRKPLDLEQDEISIDLIPLKNEDVKLLNRFNHEEVNVNYFLNSGLSMDESLKLESLCWDYKFKNIDEIKYEIYPYLDSNYRKEFLDYAIEKMIY